MLSIHKGWPIFATSILMQRSQVSVSIVGSIISNSRSFSAAQFCMIFFIPSNPIAISSSKSGSLKFFFNVILMGATFAVNVSWHCREQDYLCPLQDCGQRQTDSKNLFCERGGATISELTMWYLPSSTLTALDGSPPSSIPKMLPSV